MLHHILLLLPNTLASCLIINCEFCSPKSENICINCIQGYTRDPIQGCLHLQNPLLLNPIENCLQQKDSTCLQCSEGYNLINGFCDPICDLENCLCFYPNICLQIQRSLQCSSDQYCNTCTQDSTACEYCIDGYGINKSGICVPCDNKNCKLCPYNTYICNECLDGYYMTIEKGCYECMSSGCQSCETNKTLCDSCANGNIMVENGKCCDPSCLTCSESSPSCLSCPTNFMIFNDFCYHCSNFFCKNCTSTFCYECFEGYELFEGICIEKHCDSIGCLSCSNTTSICEQCRSNFIQDVFGNCCRKDCFTCTSISSYCTACIDGMYLENGYCLYCSDNCKTCSHYDKCLSCHDKFTLSENMEFCTEEYGDRISDEKIIVYVVVPVTVLVIVIVYEIFRSGVCCLSINNNRKKMFRAIKLNKGKNENIVITKPDASINLEMPDKSIQLKNDLIMNKKSVFFIKAIDMAIDKISFAKINNIKITIPNAKRTNSCIMRNSAEISQQSPCTPGSPQFPKIIEDNLFDDEITEKNFEKMVILVDLDSKNAYNGISTCMICKENFNGDKNIRVLPCGHPYHEECIFKSFILEKKKQCLICLKGLS
ncbi:hypothetical protein SteCoe_26844 [Stentor coeruleus]|uniref:RING-type domain-containing protein n=1 Tax=Stentor coeruleus TaxID=5963 RepID=A0A1R2BBY8_9CILI|nr:hypothetical protein SteCoe_26844 [Stentor coeruleus]